MMFTHEIVMFVECNEASVALIRHENYPTLLTNGLDIEFDGDPAWVVRDTSFDIESDCMSVTVEYKDGKMPAGWLIAFVTERLKYGWELDSDGKTVSGQDDYDDIPFSEFVEKIKSASDTKGK